MPDSFGSVASGLGYTVPALVSLMAAWVIVRRRSARFSLLHRMVRCTPASGTLTLVSAAVASRAATLLRSSPSGLASPALSALTAGGGPVCDPATPSHRVCPPAGMDRFQVSRPPRPLVPNAVCWLAGVGPQNPVPVCTLAGAGVAPTSAYQGRDSWRNWMTPPLAETVFWWLKESNVGLVNPHG